MNIFLDDCRNPPNNSYVLTTTVEETIDLLIKYKGEIGILSLDGHLGDGNRDGLKVIEWFFDNPRFPLPKKIDIHSLNPVIKKEMEYQVQRLYRGET